MPVQARAREAAFLLRSRFYAGPFSLCSATGLDADALRLVVIARASRARALLFALAVMAGIHPDRIGLARVHSVRSVRFDSCAYPVQVDGDFEGACAGEATLTEQQIRFCI